MCVLIWLPTGVAVGLIIRMLVHSRQHLGIAKAAVLGASGALAGGVAGIVMASPEGSAEHRNLLAALWAATGALILTWAYVAYSIRWESGITSDAYTMVHRDDPISEVANGNASSNGRHLSSGSRRYEPSPQRR